MIASALRKLLHPVPIMPSKRTICTTVPNVISRRNFQGDDGGLLFLSDVVIMGSSVMFSFM